MKTDSRTIVFVYHDYFNFNLSPKSLLNLAGILSSRERNRHMSQPQPRTGAPESAEPKGKLRDSTPRPLVVTGVMTRRPSPVHGLQSNVMRAFASPAPNVGRKIPFGVTLAAASVFSLACWILLFLAIRAI